MKVLIISLVLMGHLIGWSRGDPNQCSDPTVKDFCTDPQNNMECSGKGQCVCGRCVCEPAFSGKTCQDCIACKQKCEEYKDCVQCRIHKDGPLSQEACAQCSISPIGTTRFEVSEGERLCMFLDENNCTYRFKYSETLGFVIAEGAKKCPQSTEAPITTTARPYYVYQTNPQSNLQSNYQPSYQSRQYPAPGRSAHTECHSGQYMCVKTDSREPTRCIPQEWRCNGRRDCELTDDESGCQGPVSHDRQTHRPHVADYGQRPDDSSDRKANDYIEKLEKRDQCYRSCLNI